MIALLSAQAPSDAPPPNEGPRATSGQGARYDEVGYAGRAALTTNGGGSGVTSTALPVGEVVEVTALDTGKTLLLAVTGRSVSDAGQLIELSPDAAAALGIGDQARTAVRVRIMKTAPAEEAAIRAGRPGARLDAPAVLLAGLRSKLAGATAGAQPSPTIAPVKSAIVEPAKKPALTPAAITSTNALPTRAANALPAAKPPPPAKPMPAAAAAPALTAPVHGLFVQVAALANADRAAALAKSMHGFVKPAGKAYRVRIGPFTDAAAARHARDAAATHGYADARPVRED